MVGNHPKMKRAEIWLSQRYEYAN